MKTIRAFTTLLVLGMTILSACTQQPVSPAPTEPPVTQIPGETPTPNEILTITLDDMGQTIPLSVGESFLLQLDDQYNWDVSISDRSIVNRATDIDIVSGTQGVFEALAAGTVNITATGKPACLDSQPPCEMPYNLFSITFEVK